MIAINKEAEMAPNMIEAIMRAGGSPPAEPMPPAASVITMPRTTGMQFKMAFWLPIGMTAGFVALAETASSVIGTPEAALLGRLLEGGVVFWCLYHLFTKTFPLIQASHAKNVERICEVHEKACEAHRGTMKTMAESSRLTMESMTDSIKEASTANRDGMEALRKEWSDTRNVIVDAVNKGNDS